MHPDREPLATAAPSHGTVGTMVAEATINTVAQLVFFLRPPEAN